ncbi:hypothetical protein H0H92_000638 [Tricholoma furcatifolium]|nr:hypothetical protein H0H92_000638 [Tricholoma furcatifolium]
MFGNLSLKFILGVAAPSAALGGLQGRVALAEASLMFFFYSVNLGLVSFKAYQYYRNSMLHNISGVSLQKIVHYDGTFYYGCILIWAVGLIATIVLPARFVGIPFIIQLTLSPILACRMMLELREKAHRIMYIDSMMMSAMQPMDTLLFRQVEEDHFCRENISF